MTRTIKPCGHGQCTRWTGGMAEFQHCQSGPVSWSRKPGSVVTTGAAGAHHDLPGRSGEFNSIIRSGYERYIMTLD